MNSVPVLIHGLFVQITHPDNIIYKRMNENTICMQVSGFRVLGLRVLGFQGLRVYCFRTFKTRELYALRKDLSMSKDVGDPHSYRSIG